MFEAKCWLLLWKYRPESPNSTSMRKFFRQIYPPSFHYWQSDNPLESFWLSKDIDIYSAQWLNNKRLGRPHSLRWFKLCFFFFISLVLSSFFISWKCHLKVNNFREVCQTVNVEKSSDRSDQYFPIGVLFSGSGRHFHSQNQHLASKIY